jgi:hypothetical protein
MATDRTSRPVGRAVPLVVGIALGVAAILAVGGLVTGVGAGASRGGTGIVSRGEAAGVPGLAWIKAPDVARPEEAFALQSDLPQVPAGPGTAGHPGHFPGQAIIDDVVAGPDALVSVGYVGPDWQPIAWRSTDGGSSWTLTEMDEAGGTLAVALARGGDGLLVAGGYRRSAATMWTSRGGVAWTRETLPTVDPADAWTRVTALAAADGRYLAGGSVGPELFERTARFWTSEDGTTWRAVADDPAFAGGEVTAIVRTPDAWLAFGRLGTGQRTTGATAWRSTDDGATWTRVEVPSFAHGSVRAATIGADGAIVAVGSEPDEIGASAWRSADDGRTWTQAPETPGLTHFGRKIRMMAVAPSDAGYVAVGNLVEVQFGTGTSWVSPDGLTWRRSPNIPDLGQGEPLGLVRVGPPGDEGFVAVGSFGAPDNYIPRVWLSPPTP